mmetsp:Transcript_31503/g.57935  ORF Transcript_31503/g.57935 Transcript_31503/m.57935 type:complete len:220 (+) Transcript_31503:675-1334(+)
MGSTHLSPQLLQSALDLQPYVRCTRDLRSQLCLSNDGSLAHVASDSWRWGECHQLDESLSRILAEWRFWLEGIQQDLADVPLEFPSLVSPMADGAKFLRQDSASRRMPLHRHLLQLHLLRQLVSRSREATRYAGDLSELAHLPVEQPISPHEFLAELNGHIQGLLTQRLSKRDEVVVTLHRWRIRCQEGCLWWLLLPSTIACGLPLSSSGIDAEIDERR